MGWNGVCFIVLYCTSDVFVKVSLSLLVFLDLKDPFVPSVTICFMASKQYQITFGYVLYHQFPLISAIIDIIGKFYAIQEKWSHDSSDMIDLQDNNEYCEWDEPDNDYVHKSVFGDVLFEPSKFFNYNSSKLRWEIEYSMPHLSKQALFIGISNTTNYATASPLVKVFGPYQMFVGYGISFFKRQNDNPWIQELVLGRGQESRKWGVFNCISSLVENNGVDIDDLVFGKIVYTVYIVNGVLKQVIEIYPHPGRKEKLCKIRHEIRFDGYPSKPSSYFLSCSLPFQASLKLVYFQTNEDFHYRDELDHFGYRM